MVSEPASVSVTAENLDYIAPTTHGYLKQTSTAYISNKYPCFVSPPVRDLNRV